MPGRPHHTAKFKRCVGHLLEKGYEESSAYAICTTSLQGAGEPLFEGAEARSAQEQLWLTNIPPPPKIVPKPPPPKLVPSPTPPSAPPPKSEMRDLHILGATGTARTEMLDGKEYLVIPVVALMEGVIHPVNARSPEYVPLDTLRRAADSWNGRPVVLGHPVKDGKQCSANSPDIEATHRIGTIFKSRVEGRKLLQEAWIEKAKAKKLHPEMYARLAENKTEEVSVGAMVLTAGGDGEFEGRPYHTRWVETTGDHLAFLPGGRGACSVDMGCGTHRAAELHLVTASAIEPLSELPPATESLLWRIGFGPAPILAITTLEGQSLNARIEAVNHAVYDKYGEMGKPEVPSTIDMPYVQEIFDDYAIVRKGNELYSTPYTVDADGKVTLGEWKAVKQTYVEATAKAVTKECALCRGLGNLGGNPCEECDGTGEIKVLAGARHSSSDMKMIQTVHDHAVALGAACETRTPAQKKISGLAQRTTNGEQRIADDPNRSYIELVRRQAAKRTECGCGGTAACGCRSH